MAPANSFALSHAPNRAPHSRSQEPLRSWPKAGCMICMICIVLLPSHATSAQTRVSGSVKNATAVPAEYVGNWVCQSAMPGYNLPAPVITGQAPSTGRMTTPPSVILIKFRLDEDGTYTAANAKGHYLFNPDGKTIDWLDGLHHQQFSQTKVSRRSNGAPALSLIANRRHYGCFQNKAAGVPATGPKK